MASGPQGSTGEEIARKILECAPLAVQAMKEAALRGLQMPLVDRMRTAPMIMSNNLRTKDAQEGLRAFKEKRKPVYIGE
jgi:enoyl-CoA hydratase/carnithine racemase